MLEHDHLIVGVWSEEVTRTASTDQGEVIRRRPVSTPAGQALGWVQEIAPRSLPLARWFGRSIWAVVEGPDDSLLMTIHHPWGWVKPWEIFNAEDYLVSVIEAGDIFDVTGLRSARVVAEASNQWTIRNAEGSSIGAFSTSRGGDIAIELDDTIRSLPFAKMSVLAAALIETEKSR